MLHEKWSDYTKAEVKKIFTNKCMHCPYVGALHRSANGAVDEYYCNYIGITEKRRGVRPEDCEHYKDQDVPKVRVDGMGVRTLRVKKGRKEND